MKNLDFFDLLSIFKVFAKRLDGNFESDIQREIWRHEFSWACVTFILSIVDCNPFIVVF